MHVCVMTGTHTSFINESCHTYEDIPLLSMSHVTHMKTHQFYQRRRRGPWLMIAVQTAAQPACVCAMTHSYV